jgi:hypothetical protein
VKLFVRIYISGVGEATQVAEHLPIKCDALSSNPVPQKKKEKENYISARCPLCLMPINPSYWGG